MGNDLFQAMLDPYMQYSCACWKDGDTLAEAQKRKLFVRGRNSGSLKTAATTGVDQVSPASVLLAIFTFAGQDTVWVIYALTALGAAVVVSTPGVRPYSGCPGVRLPHWRNSASSSSVKFPVRARIL
mgnify:CR=1 FL=1